MLIPRKDGTFVYYPVERAVTLNPEVIVRECTLENGVQIRMHCHYGEKVLVVDPVALAAARKAEGLDDVLPGAERRTSTPIQGPTPWKVNL